MSAFAAQPTGNTWRIHASQISGYTEVILACPGSFRCSCSSGIGVLLDRFAPRHIILPSILIFALALASLSRLGPHIGHFWAGYA